MPPRTRSRAAQPQRNVLTNPNMLSQVLRHLDGHNLARSRAVGRSWLAADATYAAIDREQRQKAVLQGVLRKYIDLARGVQWAEVTIMPAGGGVLVLKGGPPDRAQDGFYPIQAFGFEPALNTFPTLSATLRFLGTLTRAEVVYKPPEHMGAPFLRFT